MGAGYAETPLWKKLGVHPGDELVLVDAPRDWRVADLPDGVTTTTETASDEKETAAKLIVAFFLTLQSLSQAVPVLGRRIFPDGAVWVAWPRRAGGHDSDIRENDIRSVALPLGLVDVKVAALDEDWSGLRLLWRRERRQAPGAGPG